MGITLTGSPSVFLQDQACFSGSHFPPGHRLTAGQHLETEISYQFHYLNGICAYMNSQRHMPYLHTDIRSATALGSRIVLEVMHTEPLRR